jgi:hypothetical protein
MATVFMESDLNISNAYNFSQHIITNYDSNKPIYDKQIYDSSKHSDKSSIQPFKLLTLIGEYHNIVFKCSVNNINIEEYVYNTLKQNKNARVYLEYDDEIDPSNLNSEPLRHTYKLLKHNNKLDRVIPSDKRQKFLTYKGQTLLYGDKKRLYKECNSVDIFYKKFIEPFFTEYRKGIFGLNRSNFSDEFYDFLTKVYLKEIEDSFTSIASKLKENYKHDKDKIRDSLRHEWMKVCDYFTLAKIFKINSHINELIVVAGVYHIENIQKVIEHFEHKYVSTLIDKKRKGDKGCISIYMTHHIPIGNQMID